MELNSVIGVCLVAYFAGQAWKNAGRYPDWVRVMVAVAAAILAVASLVYLF